MDIGHGKTVIFDTKQNEFVCIVGHGSESFAAFLNGVILQKTMRQLSRVFVYSRHPKTLILKTSY